MSQRLEIIANRIAKNLPVTNNNIDIQQLRALIFGQDHIPKIDQMNNFIISNPNLFVHADMGDMNREKQRLYAAKQTIAILKKANLDPINDPFDLMGKYYSICAFNAGLAAKSFVQYTLYLSSLLLFSNPKNIIHQQLVQRAIDLKDLGCFGLTQFYHGSYTQGIGTTATYDHKNREFILDTDGQKGMKFWIGAAAQIASKSVIWARLIVNGVEYGPHPFVVPLKDPSTYQLLPGVIIGDCGPKNGNNCIDNGFIKLDQVKIPVSYLLDKLGAIDSQGNYISSVKSNSQRFGMHMSPLSAGRAMLAQASLANASSSLAIAIRFCSNRRQFMNPTLSKQNIIIDYPLSKYRLMPLLAQTIVYYFAGLEIPTLYLHNRQILTDPSHKLTIELHGISSSLKAKSSWFSNMVVTECRQMLGGHGYSSYSRLDHMYHENDVNNTWQGDNNLLLQQTAKYLLKNGSSKNILIDLSFTSQDIESQLPKKITLQHLYNFSILQLILKCIFKKYYQNVIAKMQQLKSLQLQNMDIWNRAQPYYGRQLSLSYGDLFYLQMVLRKIKQSKSQSNAEILRKCTFLWIFNLLEKEKYSTYQFRNILQNQIIKLCEQIYKNSTALINSIAPPIEVIGSPFASEDGLGMNRYVNQLYSGKDTFKKSRLV